jgi:hypothetical protein
MIVAQPAGDINVFVQLLGRTNRKAQVAPPEYRVLMTALPSEIRPAAILEKKMRSLNANTSAKTKGIYQQKYVPDILNCYGDYIVNQYLLENPEVLHKLHLALCVTELDGLDNYRGPEEMARQFTGKASLLPIEEQQAFYEWAEGAYNDLVDMLDRTGQNELVSQDKDFRAKLISSQEIYTGEPGSVFQGPATLDKMSVVRQGRPMTTDEIADFVDDAIKRSGAEYGPNQGEVAYVNLFGEKVRQAFEQFTNQREAQGKKVTGPMQDASYRSYQLLNHLRPGQWRTNQQTGEPFVVLEIIDTFNQKSYAINPAAPSNIRVRIAIPDPVQTVIMPLSAIGNTPTYYGQIPKEEFFNVPADRREDRYIANGNIIAAMGIVVGQGTTHIRPKVLNYTMADGSRRQGLLMPKNYDPQADLPTTVRMLPQAAVTYLTEAAPGRYFVTVGEASIGVRNRELAYIQVPKSKARGLKYYGDSKLIELTGDFESRGNVMQALFPKERLLEVLTYLRDKGEGIYSDDTDPETAREYNKAYRDMGTGGTEDMGFPAGKPPKREIPVSLEPVVKPKKPMSAREIVRYISNAFGVPVRGVATFRKKRPGWYSRRTRGIRLKNVNDLRTACHEIGHHIDVYLNNLATQKMSTAWGGIGAEMVRLGKRLYGKKRPEGGYKAEGYAEAIFGYLTGGINLQEEAPRFWQFFTQHYLPDNANIAEILDAAKRMVQLWEDQGAETRVESMILDKPLKDDRRTRWEGFKLWWSTMFTDEFAPIQKLLDENVIGRTEEKASADPGFLAGFFTQTEGARARAFVMDGTMDVWGNRTGPSLKEILAPVADDIVNFTKYVVAIRAMMYEARGFTSGFQYEDVVYVYKKYHNPLWYKVAEDVTEWNHSVLQYLIDAGGLEPEAAERMRQLNPIYVPFMRAFAPYEKRLRKGVGGGLLTRAKGVYKIIGSGRPIKDPWDSMILQTRRILSIAHKTMIARALVQLEATHEGLAGVLEKVPPPTQAVHFNAEQIRKQLVQLGIDVAPGDLSDAMMTVFLNSPIFLGKEHVISVVVNGKRLWYEVDKDLYRVLEGLDQFQLPRLLNLTLGKFNRAGRLGATGINPSFGLVKNPIRDAFDSIVKAEHARGPVALIKGTAKDLQTTSLAKMLKVNPSEAARRFRVLGGQIGTYWGQDRTSLAHLKGEMLANTIGKYTLHTVTHPVDVLRAVIGVPESGLRIEEFEQALEYWMAKYQPQGGEPPPDAIVYAFLKASDQTINYRRHGVIGKWLNSMILFWNANTQDISKVYRTFKNRPKQAMYYGIAFLTLPALGLWWLNKDEDWYKELPAYEKANYLHIRLPGKNKILRLPVPFIVGHIFQGVPVAIIDTLYQSDPDRIIELCKEIFDADIQPLFDWPHAVSPFWDVARNKDWSDRPIVPKSVEGKLPSDQYKQYTTRICKEIGKLLNMSPAQIEHVINTWSGGIYRRTIVPLEQAFRLEEKEMVAADWPLIGKLFVRDPYAPRASIERFYKRVDYLNRVRQSKKDEMTVAELIEYSAHNRIARGIAPYWDDLREAKTEEERKVIYEDIGFWIKMAAEWSG